VAIANRHFARRMPYVAENQHGIISSLRYPDPELPIVVCGGGKRSTFDGHCNAGQGLAGLILGYSAGHLALLRPGKTA